MGHRRDVLVLPDLADEEHVGALAVDVEPLGRLLGQAGRCEGAEALAELDLQVDPLPVLLVARVRQDRARARANAGPTRPVPGTSRSPSAPPGDARSPGSSGRVGTRGRAHPDRRGSASPRRPSRRGPSTRGPCAACAAPSARCAGRRARRRGRHRRRRPRAGPQRFSNGPSRMSRPFATQFSATPPAMQRFFMPVRAWRSRAMRSTTSSVTFCTLAAMSQWNSSISLSGARRGLPNRFLEALVRHGQAVVVGEVPHVELERAVVPQVDQVLVDLVDVARLSIRGGTHHLVLGGVDLEAQVVGEGAVEQAERVREADLAG